MVDEIAESSASDPDATLYKTPPGHRSGFAAVVGRPNVGKSTLTNTFMRQKIAAVTPRPQTTRVRQLGIITEPDYQLILVDTPGLIREARHELDSFMLDAAADALRDADVVLWLVDANERPGENDAQTAERLAGLPAETPLLLVLNKADLAPPVDLETNSEAYGALLPRAEPRPISALTGAGVEELLQRIVSLLPEGPRYFPPEQVTDAFEREIAAELIREQLMLQLRDEVPYSTAVQVREFKERDNGTTYIAADVYVERDSQKGIVIGKGGSQLRALGEAARKEIERELVNGKVFLELRVKVEPNWRRDERSLQSFGYSSRE